MGKVVLHPGRGKAGSSSIQAWLAHHVDRLRDTDIWFLTAPPGAADRGSRRIRLAPYTTGPANANSVLNAWEAEGSERRVLLDSFFEQVNAQAARSRITVVSAEAMSVFFWRLDEEFLQRMELLARGHDVRVAYYVRPQHTALEAGWRQWGFRSGLPPSRFIAEHALAHHYFATYESVRRLAPSASFEPRPFRRDLLERGDPAADFARRFLDLTDPPSGGAPIWANRGLSLELVNALRRAPPGRFWSSMHDNSKLDRIKELLGELDAPETERTNASRSVLQAYAHATFEPGNAQLIEAMSWDAGFFVPPAEDGRGAEAEVDLAVLDELWEPTGSDTELRSLCAALERALECDPDELARVEVETARELSESRAALSAAARDLAGAQAQLKRLRASRSWRLSRRLARVSSAVRGGARGPDPAVGVSTHLERAARRVEPLPARQSPVEPGGDHPGKPV